MSDPVERIELFHIDIPLTERFLPAWIPGYPQTFNRSTLLRITTKSGVEGISAGPAFDREREGLGHLLGPYLLGTDVEDIDRVRDLLHQASFLGFRTPFVEGAFWDAKAKRAGVPVYKLIDPDALTCTELPVYCSTGSLKSPAERLKDLGAIRAAGFQGIKLRVHSHDEEEDFALLREVRRAVGDEFPLMVDANQGWLVSIIDHPPKWDLERARRFCKVASEVNALWVEEPLDSQNWADLATLRKDATVDIAGGELNRGWAEFSMLLERDCLDVYQPDCTLAGTFSECIRLAKAAKEKGRKFTPHTWTNGIGLLMNAHLKAAFPSSLPLEFPHEPPGFTHETRDAILETPLSVSERGTIALPQSPGFGIVLNEKILRRYGHRFYVSSPLRMGWQTLKNKGIKDTFSLARRKKAAGQERDDISLSTSDKQSTEKDAEKDAEKGAPAQGKSSRKTSTRDKSDDKTVL